MLDPENPQEVQPVGIVPVVEKKTPLFNLTPKHGEVLEEATLSYMQKNGIAFTKGGQELGRSIISDALRRAMPDDGIAENTNIRSIIRSGMNERAKVISAAKSLTREYQLNIISKDEKYVGPYALNIMRLVRASEEVKYSAGSLLEKSEEVLGIKNYRELVLPRIVSGIIKALPKDRFPDVSLEMFPDPESQAKLLRNSIVSIWLRGNPSPVLQIGDLQKLVNNIREPFNPQLLAPFVQYISESTGEDPLKVADYLRDLGAQVDNLFKKATYRFKENEISGDDVASNRDHVYNFFGKKLLLLHPSLEEQELIIESGRKDEGEYSLWGPTWSTEIDGMIIPNEEILQRALRIDIAKGKNGTRFQQGIQGWKKFRAACEAKEKRKEFLDKMIENVKDRIDTASIENMPANAVDRALSTVTSVGEDYRRSTAEYKERKRVIKRADDNLRKLRDLDEELRRENGGELPDQINLPWALSAEDNRKRRNTVLLASQRRAEYDANESFRKDFFARMIPFLQREEAFDFVNMDTPTIEQQISQLIYERDVVRETKGGIVPYDIELGEVGRHIDLTIRSLESESAHANKNRRGNEPSLVGFERKKLEDYIGLKESLRGLFDNVPKNLGIPRLFYEYSLNARINALQKILDTRGKRESVEGSEIGIKMTSRAEFEMNLRVAQIEAPKIDSIEAETILMHHLHEWKGVLNIFSSLDRFPFPKFVNSRTDLSEWANQMLDRLDDLPLSFPRVRKDYETIPEIQILQRERQIRSLKSLVAISNSPLFPEDSLLEGIRTKTLIQALSLRYRYMEALVDQEKQEKKYKDSTENFINMAFAKYMSNLKSERARYDGQLKEVIARDPKEEFISVMRAANLIMPADKDLK